MNNLAIAVASAVLIIGAPLANAAPPSKTVKAPAPIAQTGLKDCFDYDAATGVWSKVASCTGIVGQDGAVQAGVAWPTPRFTLNVNRPDDNGAGGGVARNGICDGSEACNGSVTDRLTGLIWLRNAYCQDFTNPTDWPGALASAAALASGKCGLTDGSAAGDWRLPNQRELQSLVDYSQAYPAMPVGHPFFGIPAASSPTGDDAYWSSTTQAIPSSQGLGYIYASCTDFATGFHVTGVKTNYYPRRVWAVKGP